MEASPRGEVWPRPTKGAYLESIVDFLGYTSAKLRCVEPEKLSWEIVTKEGSNLQWRVLVSFPDEFSV